MTSNEGNSDLIHEAILYEVLEHFIKKQEPELTKFKNDFVALPTSGTIKNALRYLNNRYSLPECISQQIGCTLPWKFAVSDNGDNGRILALLQENIIEIRKSKDGYSSIVGKASVPKDSFPQWRKLVWSPNGLILALASSNGYVSFYNSLGNNIFNISPKSVSQDPEILEAGDATAAMIFKKLRVKSQSWEYEFIRVTYSGLLKSYCISGSNGFSENHQFSFGSFYRNGVNTVLYSEQHDLFFIAGNSAYQKLGGSAFEIGLTCWRTLNDYPYYSLCNSVEDTEASKSYFSLWNLLPFVVKSKSRSVIFKCSLSPNSKLILCLHTDGTISIWSVPTLKLQKKWKLLDQPNYDAINPLEMGKPKKFPEGLSEFHPLDIGWWSNNAVIIARYSGAISVCSTDNLNNLLGASSEFLYSYPQIAVLLDSKNFMCLDCEVDISTVKRNREPNSDGSFSEVSSESETDEEDDPKNNTVYKYTTNLFKVAIYSITDIERFQPKRKKSKIIQRTYRILGIKQTTPEELYARKIELQEYDEALALAKTYNLDPDLVYQTQWRKSECSVSAIQDNLSKVSKRSWVLNECVTQVPETLEATRELLNFGLKGANLETLVAIGESDDGKFITSDYDNDNENLDDTNKQLKEMQRINEIFAELDLSSLKDSQKLLIKYRKMLLNHLDKLQTYEIILDSSQSKFKKSFYEKFRQLTPIENAVKFAKEGNYRGVEIMFTYYGKELMQHWLAIISFFPETLNPENYRKLLPECDIDGRLFLLYQQELRQKDWVERIEFAEILNCSSANGFDFLYENHSLSIYKNKDLDLELLLKWYKNRACEIERESRLVDNALSLVIIGKSHNIRGLENLLFELETLDDLVYKVGLEDLSLKETEKLSCLEKLKLLMVNSNKTNFICNIKMLLIPFSKRKQKYLVENCEQNLLHDYLVFLSKGSLELPVTFFEHLKLTRDTDLLECLDNLVTLAIDCIYACNNDDMYTNAKSIIHSVLAQISNTQEKDHRKCKELENELKCMQIMNKYDVYVPLHHIKRTKDDIENAKILLNQMTDNLIKNHSSPNEKQWNQILNDMLDIQGFVLNCLDVETCFEICLSARLRSKSLPVIQGCQALIEIRKSGPSLLKVSYKRAVELILKASNEYFNNSKSLVDPDMELARACLQLISDDNSDISEEYDLIESLQILSEFKIKILPVQVRLMTDRIKLIESCLDSKNDAYKSKQKLLNLASYLRIEQKNNKLREGKILDLIAHKAFYMKDFSFCSTIIAQMIRNNYHAAWKIALDFGFCRESEDFQFQLSCIWFAISNGPSDIIEKAIKQANLIQMNILENELEKWKPHVFEDKEEETDVCKFSNEIAKESNNEFVPKILETSAGIFKNSVDIMKQSTFELLKSAGNTDFWKEKLSFNLVKDYKSDCDDENVLIKSKVCLQKFPCFYETLHENCGISSLGTNYSKYSLNDCHPNLKLAQILLRMSMLNETIEFGKEVKDINHLLLECAKYTIEEDSILGLIYLLNANFDNDSFITDLFEILPENDTYTQILAYFLSLKLYMKLFPDCVKLFSYDPIDLIKLMSAVTIQSDDNDAVLLQKRINELICAENESNTCSNDDVFQSDNAFEKKVNLNQTYTKTKEEEGWDDWDNDNWDEEENLGKGEITKGEDEISYLPNEQLIETIHEDTFKISSIEEYKDLKMKVLSYPDIENLMSSSDINVNPLLMLLFHLTKVDISNEIIFHEIKDFVSNDKLISASVMKEFFENYKDDFSVIHILHFKLCSKEQKLQEEAVTYIKDNYKDLHLNSLILEEIFFKNLTSSFTVGHELYYQIIESVFMNRTMPEIEANIKILINNLMKQGNIPHAVALKNQLEGIPRSLSTYDTCLKVLLRK